MQKCIISQILKLGILGVVIHPDIVYKILGPMVKKLALYDLWFLSYGQKTAFLAIFEKWAKSQFFGNNSKIISCRELIPSP